MSRLDEFTSSSSSAGDESGGLSLDAVAQHEGWKMMPLLFDTWDLDNSGTIDRFELTRGMKELIKDHGLSITTEDVLQIMTEVDLNDDDQLDRREFGCFLSRIAAASGKSLDSITYPLLKQRQERVKENLERFKRESSSLERAWTDIPRLFSIWDFDKDGKIDREEVAVAVNKYLRSNGNVKVTLQQCLVLMDEVDMTGERVLDIKEFGVFMARFAVIAGVSLDKLTGFFMDDRREGMGKSKSLRGSAFSIFFGKMTVGMVEESMETNAQALRRHPAR